MKKEDYFSNYSVEVQNIMKGTPVFLPVTVTILVSALLLILVCIFSSNDNLKASRISVHSLFTFENDDSLSDTICVFYKSRLPLKIGDSVSVIINDVNFFTKKEFSGQLVEINLFENGKYMAKIKTDNIRLYNASFLRKNILLETEMLFYKSEVSFFDNLFVTGNN